MSKEPPSKSTAQPYTTLISSVIHLSHSLLTSIYFRFRYASQLKSPTHSHEERRLRTEELNRKNAQQNEIDRIESGGTNRSHVLSVHRSPESQRSLRETQIDSDDAEDITIAISDMQRPLSHTSTATTRSARDEANSLGVDNLSKSSYSIGQSSIEEIITPKSGATTADNLEVESEAIDTSLEHIQNENNEKLIIAVETNVAGTGEGIDTVDCAEKTAELIIQTQPELLLDSPCITIQKACEVDYNEPRSESESMSITSTEESSEYQAMRENTAKTITVPIGDQKVINKPIPKIRPAILSRRNKIAPGKTYSSSASLVPTHKAGTFPPSLRKFDKPREASNSCLNQLDSPNWETTMNGLQNFVRLIRHHPEAVELNIHAYCVAIAKQVRNLRSQVSRSACQASAEFFETHAKHLEQESEDLAFQLFNRTADTNKFLRADAYRALVAMCDNLPPGKVIQLLLTRGATHPNAVVRTTTANLCNRIVSRLGYDRVFTMHREYRDKLILAGAHFLMEGSLDTRNNAKALFKQLSAHPHYSRVLQEVIPQRIYRNIEKALKSIK